MSRLLICAVFLVLVTLFCAVSCDDFDGGNSTDSSDFSEQSVDVEGRLRRHRHKWNSLWCEFCGFLNLAPKYFLEKKSDQFLDSVIIGGFKKIQID
jgi:hypothetical protein